MMIFPIVGPVRILISEFGLPVYQAPDFGHRRPAVLFFRHMTFFASGGPGVGEIIRQHTTG
jgi:hypothetical protein